MQRASVAAGPWWPAAAFALLLACSSLHANAKKLAPGICQSMDIRNNPNQFEKLRGCRVVEGQLSIVLMEHASPKTFENISFPELREVTDFIKIYRVKGIRNLGDIFPNLTVVRGMRLYKEYAIVVFDSADLESLGLRSLSKIERGAVRIQLNDRLCYTNTIDWSEIISENDLPNVKIRGNYDTRLCGLCPNAHGRMEDHKQSQKQCPADASGRLLCWDDKHCQRICPRECEPHGCTPNNECCPKTCLGGCSGNSPRDCYVCKNYSIGYGSDMHCVDKCPANTYKLKRRCVTEQECRQMPTPPAGAPDTSQYRFAPTINAYKILENDTCVFICPSGYMEAGDQQTARCIPCPEGRCKRECTGARIDSVAAAEQFRGCTHIKGTLEFALRAQGGVTMAPLELYLGEIREIVGCLKVTRSYTLISLTFLKSLRKIVGVPTENDGQALIIFNNPNLEILWDWDTFGKLNITGRLHIHLNPKLCYSQILPLQNMTHNPRSNFTEKEVSAETNGDQASCSPQNLELKVSELRRDTVILQWDTYCISDVRKLLGYSVYYIAAETDVTLYGQRDACSDSWNVRDVQVSEVKHTNRSLNETDNVNATAVQQQQTSAEEDAVLEQARNNSQIDAHALNKYYLENSCASKQPQFQMIRPLVPYTRYAAYVKAFTTQHDKKGALSPIIYFRTLPGQPSPPAGLSVESTGPHSVKIKWGPPTMPNGTIMLYHVKIQANSYNRPKILAWRNNYCGNPNALANIIAGRVETPPEKEETKATGDVKNGSCSCKDENSSTPKFTSRAEEEREETIFFENELQNGVYIKSDKALSKESGGNSRARRSIDNTLNSMLVILSENADPQPGLNYTNTTDKDAKCSRVEPNVCVVKDNTTGYVQSLFYNLSTSTTSLAVEGLRHFTWYTVNVWACRERDPNEAADTYDHIWCSKRAFNIFRTLELTNADEVTHLQAEVLPSNKTLPEVNITWQPPQNPNGFVVAYNVHYTRIEDNSQGPDVGLQTCLMADEYEANGRGYIMRTTQAGNYSIRVTPITISGAGNVSDIYVFIPERTGGGQGWVWGVAGGCLALALAAAAGVWYARRGLLPPADNNKLFASVNPEYTLTVYVPDEWEVPRANVQLVRELGQGSFGMVYEGIVKNIEKGKAETRCAVKTVNEHATDRERIEFLNEASVMKAFDTFHVVRLLGVVSRGQPTLVVMELMEQGDLKTYLRSHRPDPDNSAPRKPDGSPPTLQNILQMAIEIADGMAYLSAKKFVHRDLAARNCMVAGDLTVKVGDFGMTRDIYETDYYRKGTKGLLPVRWMSPESLKDGVFSSSTDVWSYGVVLWEMATLAMQPYQGLSNEQVVRYVVSGGVMERPEHCPDRLYELMRACWAHRPHLRPSFLRLVADLAPSAQPHFRQRSFFHTPQGQEMYALQRSADEEQDMPEVNVGAVATGSGSNLFGVSGRLASWVRELSSVRSRASDDAAAEPLQPVRARPANGDLPPSSGC